MNRSFKYLALATATAFTAASALAAPVIVGTGGNATANGVVTAPPADGPGFRYISTLDGVSGVGQISGVGGTNGSTYTSDSFTANAGGQLTFYFNYVTSDGAIYADYAWSALLDGTGTSVTDYIFSARTTPTGDTVPGFGLPGLNATLSPATTPIIPGGPEWDKLGALYSGSCYDVGCGYTGWIKSTYTITTAGTYRLGFGVTNLLDEQFDSGLAFTTAFVDGKPIDPGVPEPATWAMLISGFGLVGAAARRRRNRVAAA